MGPQSPQHPVLRGIFVQMARNLPPSIHADQELTTMSLAKRPSLRASCVTLGSIVKVMHGCGPMTIVTKVSSALGDRGLVVLETLVWLTTIMPQALLTAVTQCSNVCARHGTKQQVEQTSSIKNIVCLLCNMGNCGRTLSNKLQKLQNRAARVITSSMPCFTNSAGKTCNLNVKFRKP